jgi:hypothetical protein
MLSELTRKERWLIFCFGIVGAVIAVVFSLLLRIAANSHGWFAAWSVVAACLFCPAYFVFGYWEMLGEQLLSMSYNVRWFYIILTNCLLYPVVGLVFVAFWQNRTPRKSSAS